MNFGNFLVFNYIILLVLIITAFVLIIKHIRLCIKYGRLYKYIYNHLNLIISARYGNFNNKIEDGIDPLTIQISRNTNALLESIIDRDKMIQEYIQKEKESQNIKQDFISCLAHDLKVPIIAQDNTYDLFLEGNFGNLSPVQKDVIKNLKNSNMDLKNLVINFLEAQKFDSEELNLNLEKVNLVDFLKEVIVQNQSIATAKEKEIFFNFNCNEIFGTIDKLSFKRALNNLIYNALNYSKDAKNIDIDLVKNDDGIQLTVRDYGKGIDEEDINNIFKKYYTSSKKFSNASLGLGLYIVNKIISAHKGMLYAKNNPQCGASFTITLPL